MFEEEYNEYNEYNEFGQDDLENMNANEADDYRNEGMEDFTPSFEEDEFLDSMMEDRMSGCDGYHDGMWEE